MPTLRNGRKWLGETSWFLCREIMGASFGRTIPEPGRSHVPNRLADSPSDHCDGQAVKIIIQGGRAVPEKTNLFFLNKKVAMPKARGSWLPIIVCGLLIGMFAGVLAWTLR